ncbi:bacteriocin immunity protein, partial [Listeria monocytogenes]
DIFKVKVGVLPEGIQDNLKADKELNNNLSAFYEEGTSKKEMFLMYSNNFQRSETNTFFYETYLKKDSEI